MKKAKVIILTIILLAMIIVNPLPARKVGNMPEVSNFSELYIFKNKVYAIDTKIHVDIYELNPFRYIKQASKYGAGPGECPVMPSMVIYPDYFYLFRYGRCMYFSLNGDYIKEYRIPKPNLHLFAPLGKNFLSHKITDDQTASYHELSICTYTEKEGIRHKKVAYIYVSPHRKQKNNRYMYCPFGDFFKYSIVGDKIFIPDSTRGMFAEIYDFNGNRFSQIRLNYEKLTVPEENKKKLKEKLEAIPAFSAMKDRYYLDFLEYYPAFQYAALDKGKVYFLTFYKKGQMREIIIADWKGKFIKRSYVTVLNDTEIIKCAISDNKFYYLFENEESEEWELHVEDIK